MAAVKKPVFERAGLDRLVSLASLTPSDLPRTRPPESDRKKLDALFTTAAIDTSPRSRPAGSPPMYLGGAARSGDGATQTAPNRPTRAAPVSRGRWAPQPEFDDDHPDEISYRPFPIAPLLTDSPSADDAALATVVHPDVARTLELMSGGEVVMPLRLRPGPQKSQAMSAQQFRGEAVDLSAMENAAQEHGRPPGLTSRQVKTTAR